jgi:thioredoxin 1
MRKLLTFAAVVTALSLSGLAQDSLKTHTAKPATATKTKVKSKKPTKAAAIATKPKVVKLPKLVDLGAGKCIPCKMMAPVLEELKEDYAGKMEVVFIDVWQNSSEGDKYGIKLIPTQIFYGADGKELFRHEGFFAKADILAKWKELGFDLGK